MSDAQEALVDKLRGGDFDQLVDGSTKMMEKQMEQQMEQQLCLQADGDIVKGNPFDVCKPGKRTSADADGNSTSDDCPPLLDLEQIRQARIAEMKTQKKMNDHWRSLGHGRYREIDDERAFFKEVAPHERVACVIHAEYDDLQNSLHESVDRLAEKHMETAFLRLRENKAHFMMKMVDFGNLPCILVLRHGKVTTCLGARRLRGLSYSQLERLLWSQDVLGVGDYSDENSDSD